MSEEEIQEIVQLSDEEIIEGGVQLSSAMAARRLTTEETAQAKAGIDKPREQSTVAKPMGKAEKKRILSEIASMQVKAQATAETAAVARLGIEFEHTLNAAKKASQLLHEDSKAKLPRMTPEDSLQVEDMAFKVSELWRSSLKIEPEDSSGETGEVEGKGKSKAD